MLTIRGADQVCTSLRAARKSLADGGVTPRSRIDELDLMIGELVVGAPSFRGDAARSKAQIESLVTSLTQRADGAVAGDEDAAAGQPGRESMPPGVHDALGHFRRAVATLERLNASQDTTVP